MISMEILGKIQRINLRDKLSLHEITKRTGARHLDYLDGWRATNTPTI